MDIEIDEYMTDFYFWIGELILILIQINYYLIILLLKKNNNIKEQREQCCFCLLFSGDAVGTSVVSANSHGTTLPTDIPAIIVSVSSALLCFRKYITPFHGTFHVKCLFWIFLGLDFITRDLFFLFFFFRNIFYSVLSLILDLVFFGDEFFYIL